MPRPIDNPDIYAAALNTMSLIVATAVRTHEALDEDDQTRVFFGLGRLDSLVVECRRLLGDPGVTGKDEG